MARTTSLSEMSSKVSSPSLSLSSGSMSYSGFILLRSIFPITLTAQISSRRSATYQLWRWLRNYPGFVNHKYKKGSGYWYRCIVRTVLCQYLRALLRFLDGYRPHASADFLFIRRVMIDTVYVDVVIVPLPSTEVKKVVIVHG